MKHNLETIKEKLDAHFQSQNKQSFDALQEEINGFEKELREHLATDGTFEYKRPHQRMRSRTTEVGKFIKEILGGTKK